MSKRTPEALRVRDIGTLREKLSLVCKVVLGDKISSAEHLWSIPVDKERDFDSMFSDAFSELEWRRAAMSELLEAINGYMKRTDKTANPLGVNWKIKLLAAIAKAEGLA